MARKHVAVLLVFPLLIPGLVACQGTPQVITKQQTTLNVSASVVMTDALKEINQAYTKANPAVSFVTNFASAGTIQRQIENGAQCDVFLSAASNYMDNLQKEGLLLDGSRRDILTNKLVLITNKSSNLGVSSFNDLTSAKVKMIAIGDPASVSAGGYAQQAFDLLGISAALKPKLILTADVRQVLTYVETSNVDAGVVFATDALTSNSVRVVANAPDEINRKIVYPVAVIKASKNTDAAKDYLSFLGSDAARQVFEQNGFSMAGG